MGRKEDNAKLIARLSQLEAEISICTQGSKQMLADLSAQEAELLGTINSLQQQLLDVVTEKNSVMGEYTEVHSRLLKEYRSIESHLLASGEKPGRAETMAGYADLKSLLADDNLRNASREIALARGCWTCTDCVTNCTECVTSCTQCVTSTCLTSTTPECTPWDSVSYAPCSPKPDVGNQVRTGGKPNLGRLTINWDSDTPTMPAKPEVAKPKRAPRGKKG